MQFFLVLGCVNMIKYDTRKFDAYQIPAVDEADFQPIVVEKKESGWQKLKSWRYRQKQDKMEKIWLKQLKRDNQNKKQ